MRQGQRRALRRLGLVSAVAALAVAVAQEENGTSREYVVPQVEGLHLAETFDGDVWSRWSQSQDIGKFALEKRKQEALVGDIGLLVPEEAKHYGASTSFTPIVGNKEASFVVQYEVKLQDGQTCGGMYLKLFDSAGVTDFKADTPYVVMFGPDKCGGTDKVHFILRHRNPKTGTWEEKHFKEPPHVPGDTMTHLYGLIVNPDNSFEIQIDGTTKASGNLLSSMEPPVNPAQEIDDPEDSKPGDWVDEAKIDDPQAAKPDDWDEDAPMTIEDPSEVKPDGWVDDQPKKIAEPSAKKPEDWDDEEDGEWEAPMIDNPACTVGCGEWRPARISNPAYKGKWRSPKIDNPEYKGVWKPRQIANPDYFFDEAPGVLPKIDSVGIDIWTMSKGIMFDNLVVTDDASKAAEFARASFKLRAELEELQRPKPTKGGGFIETATDFLAENMVAAGITFLLLLGTTAWCCFGGSASPAAPTDEERRALRQQKRAQQAAEKAAQEPDDKDAAEEQEDEQKEETKPEGGVLGDSE